jgi:hypothetical protein
MIWTPSDKYSHVSHVTCQAHAATVTALTRAGAGKCSSICTKKLMCIVLVYSSKQ